MYLSIIRFNNPITSIQRSVHPSIHSPIHLFTYLTTYTFNHPSIHPSIHLSIQAFIYLYHSSICPTIHATMLPSVNPKFHPFIKTPIHSLTLNSPISLLIHAFHLFENLTNQFINISILLYV